MDKPKIYFEGGYPEWKVCKIEDVVNYERPDSYIVKSTNYQSEGVPVLTANKSFVLGFTDEDFGIYESGEAVIFDDFTCDSKYVNFRFKVKSSAIKILTAKDGKKLSMRFFGEALASKAYKPNGHQRHWIGIIQKQEIKLPCYEEQQKIATFFSSLDSKIGVLEEQINKMSSLRDGLLRQLFERKIAFKFDEPNGSVDWKEMKIKDVAPLQRGFDLPSSELEDGDCNVIYSNGQVSKHNRYKCEGCAVVTGRSGTIGKVFYLDYCKYWPHNTTLWVTDFCGNLPKFVFYLFQFVGLERFSTGTGVPTLNRNDVHDFIVKIPNYQEQEKIVAFMDAISLKIELLNKRRDCFVKMKNGFVKQMFV